jgi:pimeloyl-ACP methyl ester carboxylesterase
MTTTLPQTNRSYSPEDWQKGYISQPIEDNYWIEDIEGEIPPDLTGTLFRNGPGLFEIAGTPIKHPFDGDGMIAALHADRAAFLKGFLKDFYGVGLLSAPVSDAQLDWSLAIALQAGLKGTIECVRAFSSTDFRPDLASFTMPTLIIHGTDDKTVPIELTARTAAAAIPHAQLIEYDGAPHGLLATHKDSVTRDLIAFLDG